jgi:tetratricopeptide (TPR) repeat protein
MLLVATLLGWPLVAHADAVKDACFGDIAANDAETIKACTALIARGPEDAAYGYYDRGIAHYHLEQFGLATDDFSHAIELMPTSADAYRNRCWSYSAAQMTNLALADCDKAISLNTRCGDCWSLRAQVHKQAGDLVSAVRDIDEAIRQRPEEAQYFRFKGRFLEDMGDIKGALAAYGEAHRLDPKDDGAQEAISWLTGTYNWR